MRLLQLSDNIREGRPPPSAVESPGTKKRFQQNAPRLPSESKRRALRTNNKQNLKTVRKDKLQF
jgi:hypothetical protein